MTTVYATRFPSGDEATLPTDLNRDRSLLTSPCGFAAAEKPSEPIATTAVAVLTFQLKHLDALMRHPSPKRISNSFRPVILGTCRCFVNEADLLREDEFCKRMRVELVPPNSDTEPRHWVRHDQAFAMMLGPGSIEWGSKRSALEKFAYAAGDLALCDRHQGEWVGLMNVPHLQLGISDAALMAASDEPNGEVELRPHRKFADSRLGTLATIVHAEMVAGFPSGRLFLDSIEQAMAVALVSSQAVRHRPVRMSRGGLAPARLRRITDLVHARLEDELGLDELA